MVSHPQRRRLVVCSSRPPRHRRRSSSTTIACRYHHLWVTLITVPRSRSPSSRATWSLPCLERTSPLFSSHSLVETSQPSRRRSSRHTFPRGFVCLWAWLGLCLAWGPLCTRVSATLASLCRVAKCRYKRYTLSLSSQLTVAQSFRVATSTTC